MAMVQTGPLSGCGAPVSTSASRIVSGQDARDAGEIVSGRAPERAAGWQQERHGVRRPLTTAAASRVQRVQAG